MSKQSLWQRKYRRRLCFALLLLAYLWLIAWAAARWLIVSAPLGRADVILVLSGSSALLERTHHAARLYNEQRSKKILVTRDDQRGSWSSAEQRNPYFYEIAVAELGRLGVPSQAIEVVGPPVQSTWEEAISVGEYAATHDVHSILIVTSSYHSRRALWTFRHHLDARGVQVGLDPVETGIQTPSPATWWLHIKGWQVVFLEYLKFVYYCCRRS